MYRILTLVLFLTGWLLRQEALHAEGLFLRDNLQRAQVGDYLVISSNKTDTLMHIHDKQNHILTIEEIAVPENRRPSNMGWKEWVLQEAPGHTSWVMYDIDLHTGQMLRYYSFSKKGWFEIPEADNFLSKLLNLKLTKIPMDARKRVGPKPKSGPDWRPLWQPRMVVEGCLIKNVPFNAWQTKWPRDGVYKLSAIRDPGGGWKYKLKLSEQMLKVSNPGILQVKRFFSDQENIADVIYDVQTPLKEGSCVVDPLDPTKEMLLKKGFQGKDLLEPIFCRGKCVYSRPSLQKIRAHTYKELSHFQVGIKRFLNPHLYFVGMEKSLYDLKIHLIKQIRQLSIG